MLNKIWFGLLLIGIVYGFGKAAYRTITDRPAAPSVASQPAATQPVGAAGSDQVADSAAPVAAGPARHFRDAGKNLTDASLDAGEAAVGICITLIGVMALWLGMLNIAREAGLVEALARVLRPVTRLLFPGVPAGHPAEGAMLMNISANMMGLGNAATPFGLKAMRDLQELNPVKDTATNAMVTFLALNTSSVTIVPFTTIALRVAEGSEDATSPLAGMILATMVSTTVAIIATRLLAGLPGYRAAIVDAVSADSESAGDQRGGD